MRQAPDSRIQRNEIVRSEGDGAEPYGQNGDVDEHVGRAPSDAPDRILLGCRVEATRKELILRERVGAAEDVLQETDFGEPGRRSPGRSPALDLGQGQPGRLGVRLRKKERTGRR